ncbi:MAG: ABC transporter permease [Catalinimonas sp.]
MNYAENIREGVRSVKGNLLRSVLTALIIAIGITALVGILTSIDGIRGSVNQNLGSLGANTFEIDEKIAGNRRFGGRRERQAPPIEYGEAQRFRDLFAERGTVSMEADVAFAAELKRGDKKTNPNSRITGSDEHYLAVNGAGLEAGRNFTPQELQYGAKVALLGGELVETLFDDNESPLGKDLMLLGTRFRVIGVLESTGGVFGGQSRDRMALIPIDNATQLATDRELNFEITVAVTDRARLDAAVSEATGIMRRVRGDRPGDPNSFEIEKKDSVGDSLDDITGKLRLAGFGIAFITLLGASIGLMNIMLVSVTERTREIGVRKALGATPRRIREQFLIEAVVICQLGGALGVLFGVGIGNLVARIVGMNTFLVPWVWIVVALVVCVLVGVLSGYYPARKASRLDPIESLRYE